MLLERFGHAGWERVVPRLGLHKMSEFLRDTLRGEVPTWQIAEMEKSPLESSLRLRWREVRAMRVGPRLLCFAPHRENRCYIPGPQRLPVTYIDRLELYHRLL
jgi:hypothetical protein